MAPPNTRVDGRKRRGTARWQARQIAPIAVLDADAVERAARVWGERAELRANGRAAAERVIAHLRNVEDWKFSEGADLLLQSIGIIGR